MAGCAGEHCHDRQASLLNVPSADADKWTVIFGEIIPQSICVRYGLPIGAWMSPLVLILMYILAPVAWPTAKLLDYLLGEDHGTTYKKAGLKTLVTLHKSLGAAGEQLNQDEVTIISAVLDLKAKPVGNIMTPMADVFIMSANTVLDEATMEVILGAGYSRIPIHAPDNEQNFVGMLLVKILITYDPEDCKRVRDFALATLPETRAETSCLDIVNFFQEGKSHMVLVSEYPGEDHGALGVVTLEDVIEELIGEEIIDESDVYIDVHKAIRRLNPAPKSRVPKGEVVTEQEDTIADAEESLIDVDGDQKDDSHTARKRNSTAEGLPIKVNGNNQEVAVSPGVKHAFRRSSSIANVSDREGGSRSRQMNPEMREHLKHLGPSNLASRPRTTRYNTVKIKPGAGPRVEGSKDGNIETPRTGSMAAQGGAGGGVLGSAGKDAKDGVLAVQAGYGTIAPGSPPTPKNPRKSSFAAQASEETRQARLGADNDGKLVSQLRSRGNSHSTVGSLNGRDSPSPPNKRGTARSGSITENIIEAGGIRKTVLEMTSSSDDLDEGGARVRGGGSAEGRKSALESGEGGRKKRRRRKRKPGEKGGEEEPLLKANAAAAGGGRGGDRS